LAPIGVNFPLGVQKLTREEKGETPGQGVSPREYFSAVPPLVGLWGLGVKSPQLGLGPEGLKPNSWGTGFYWDFVERAFLKRFQENSPGFSTQQLTNGDKFSFPPGGPKGQSSPQGGPKCH